MKQKINILIVEDSTDDFFLLNEALLSSRELDAKIFHEGRLESAISVAKNEVIDAAVIDLSLPDSFGLATFISFHAKHPGIPAIIVTATKDHDLALKAIQNGAQDYVFKGEPSATAIIRTILYAIERQRLMTELKSALEHVKLLQGLLPICAACKKIRDDKGYWNNIESYLSKHLETTFSHTICDDCMKKLYPEFCGDE